MFSKKIIDTNSCIINIVNIIPTILLVITSN